jgi:hypothetical protein
MAFPISARAEIQVLGNRRSAPPALRKVSGIAIADTLMPTPAAAAGLRLSVKTKRGCVTDRVDRPRSRAGGSQ